MGLRVTAQAALEWRRARKQKAERLKRRRKELQERTDRAYALTPQELAQRISAGELADPKIKRWARPVFRRDPSSLALDVAGLPDRERAALSCRGWVDGFRNCILVVQGFAEPCHLSAPNLWALRRGADVNANRARQRPALAAQAAHSDRVKAGRRAPRVARL
jgi:hypothetical protein